MTLPKLILVDTNVPLVANGNSPQPFLSEDEQMQLEEQCIEVIQVLIDSATILVLDEDDRIVSEYGNKLNPSGQPGVGDRFLRWVYQNGWNEEQCERRPLTCQDEDEQVFGEFPEHEALQEFDISDRKFVATANAGSPKPPIFQAVDYKWWGWKDALNDVGITIRFVDEEVAKRGYQEHLDGQ